MTTTDPGPGGAGDGSDGYSRSGFRRMVTAETLSLTADRLLGVALPLFVLDRTGSAALTAAAVLAQALPLALFGALGGAVVDRADRRRVLVAASATRCALALPMLLVVAQVLPVAAALVMAAGLATIGQVTGPAVGSTLPSLVPATQLPRANAQLAARNVVIQLAAPTVGAFLYGWAGLGAVIVIDSLLFAGATLGFARLSLRPVPPVRKAGVLRETVDGIRRVRQDPVLARLLAAVGLGLVGLSLELAVLVPFIREVLDGPPASVGLLTSVEAVGGLLAAALFPRLLRRLGMPGVLSIGMAGLPVATLGLLLSSSVLHAVPGMLLAGLPLTLLTAAVRVHVQTSVERGYLGRVVGVIASVIGGAAVLGSALAMALTTVLDLRAILLVAVVVELAGVAMHLLWTRRSRLPAMGLVGRTSNPDPTEGPT